MCSSHRPFPVIYLTHRSRAAVLYVYFLLEYPWIIFSSNNERKCFFGLCNFVLALCFSFLWIFLCILGSSLCLFKVCSCKVCFNSSSPVRMQLFLLIKHSPVIDHLLYVLIYSIHLSEVGCFYYNFVAKKVLTVFWKCWC